MAKTSRNKKRKLRLHTPTLCHYSPLGVCNLVFFVFLFFLVSRRFCYFSQKQKTRDNTKDKIAHLKGGAMAESWVLSFFCILGFLPEIFETPTELDHRENNFVKKNIFFFQDLTTYTSGR